MKKILFGFLFGLVAGAGGHWYLTLPEDSSPLKTAKEQVIQSAEELKDQVIQGAEGVKDSIKEQAEKISTEKIKEEIAKTGTFIREKTQKATDAVADAASDTRTTTTIKAKLAKAPGVSALRIKVSTTDGLVTLSGSADSADEIKKAVALALDTEGVRKVISTIELR